jgi:endonuclease G, mitochondrial
MRRFSLFVAAAALLAAGAATAAAQTANSGFTPGPNNDPATCHDLWEGVGLPQYSRTDEHDTTFVCHTKYVLSHNDDAKTPDWVLEHLTVAQITGTNARPKMKFQHDPFLPPDARAVDADYTRSGFDRGHQAPSDDFKANVDWMKESFFLSNIVPQVGVGFNRDIWATLENHVRDVVRSRGELYVITGPVYPDGGTPITIGDSENLCHNVIVLDPPAKKSICGGKSSCENGVIVPSAMFKIFYDPNMGRVNAFLMPNVNHREVPGFTNSLDYIKKYQVTVQAVEDVTNLSFFSALPAGLRHMVETQCAAVIER